MSCSLSLQIPKALPVLRRCERTPPRITSELKPFDNTKSVKHLHQKVTSNGAETGGRSDVKNRINTGVQLAALLASVEQPALALTGVNNPEDFNLVLIEIGIIAFGYFIVAPPIIMNWLRARWYKRKLLEMYLQFMFVFIFFPGVMLWAPFLNFRKFPRDPSMKYPWSKPEDPSKIKGGYLKYPWATIDDYDYE